MPKMKFSHLLEMLQEAGQISVSTVIKGSPRIGLEFVGLNIPDESPLMNVATEFRNYYLGANKKPEVAILLTEKARDCWRDMISVSFLEEEVYKKWSEKKKKSIKEEMAACGD